MGTGVSKESRQQSKLNKQSRRSKRATKATTATVFSVTPEVAMGARVSATRHRNDSYVRNFPPPVLIYDVRSDAAGLPTGWEIVTWNFQHSVPESFIKLAIEASITAKRTREPAHFEFQFESESPRVLGGAKPPTCVCVFHCGTSAQGQDRFSMYTSSTGIKSSSPKTPRQAAGNEEELACLRAELKQCQDELEQFKRKSGGIESLKDELERVAQKYETEVASYKKELAKCQDEVRKSQDEVVRNKASSEAMVKEKAKEQLKINEEIKEASKAKTQFLATMSHEIRTPLSVVIATTNLLVNTALSTEQSEMVHSIRSCGEYLLVLVNNILDVSKLEASLLVLDQSEFSLKTTLEEAMDIMAQDARRKKIDLVFDVAPEVPALLIGDPFRLRQVLINLLSNATKFTQENGSVFFAAQLVDPVDESGQCTVQISVTDTGVGIPEDGHSKLFQIFTQYDASTTRKFGGSGLGLAISKRLVEMMAGNIWFESTPGKGTTFYFTVRVKVVQPHVPAPTPFCLLGAMWYKNQEWPDIIAIGKSEHLNHVIKAKLARPQARTSSLTGLDNIMDAIDKSRKTVLMIDEDVWSEAPKERKLQIVQSTVEGIVLMSHEPKGANPNGCEKKTKPGLNRVSFLRKPFKDLMLAECVANCLGQTISEVKKNVVSVCPLAAKMKRGILLATKYPLKILVADDNKMILQVMKKSLANLGYKDVKTVENGKEAIDELNSNHYDVILMDMQMPVMDGCEAAQQIRKTYNQCCHIIALTANAFTEDRERCISAGMCSYMSKPVRMDVLKQELKLAFRELHSDFSTCICKMTGDSSPSSSHSARSPIPL
jgi:signal transduction histidine kinase/CheY-like chemotaxis protein